MTIGNDLLTDLLAAAFQARLVAPSAEEGIAGLSEAAHRAATVSEWRDTVDEAVRRGLIYDPVRLPEGALQCHWHLELTPLGVETVRRTRGAGLKSS